MAYLNTDAGEENAWAYYWQNRPIPILESSKIILQQMLRRVERIRASDIAQVVLADPLLTLQALRLIGRRERTSLAAEVVSVESIVMLMGAAPFLERFCSLTTVENVLHAAPQDYLAFMQQVFIARFSARLALVYADMRYDARVEEIMVSAILSRCNVQLGLIGKHLDPGMPEPDAMPVKLLEQQRIAQVVVSMLGFNENTSPRIALQQSVLRLAEEVQAGWWQPSVQSELNRIADVLEVKVDSVWQALCRVLLGFAHDPMRMPELFQPARWLAMLPGDWPSHKPKAVANIAAQTNNLTQHLQSLKLASQQKTAAKDVMTLAVRALAEGVGMRRIVFALLMPGKPILRARYVLGWPSNHAIRKWQEQTHPTDLFDRLLEKPQGFWLNTSSAVKYQDRIPAFIHECFDGNGFCMMSIFAGKKPIGVIMADRGGKQALVDLDYQNFKNICLLTSRALTHNAE